MKLTATTDGKLPLILSNTKIGGGLMYPVSQEYISTIEKGGYETKIIGTITLKDETIIVINNSSLIKGTLYINSQCVDNSDFNIGAVYANELGLGLFGEDDFNRYDDAVIEMRFGITTSETTIEYVPLGIYTVVEPKRTGKFINLKALDNMILLDENLDGVGTSGTLFDLTTYCLERCGVDKRGIRIISKR